MSQGQGIGVARDLRAIWGAVSIGGMSDGQLLARFVERRDEGGELAFEALVGRHGPMVLRVARDVLRDPHSAEDAFQATFLVLARKARSIARPETLGPWLHGVAHRVALKARAEADRRRRHESRAAERSPRAVEPGDTLASQELHEEVARLPNSCRVAVVLCYFEGLTYEQAARRLGVTEATVRGRLSRARRDLRGHLAARGSAAWSLPMVPGRWIGPTARAASRFARGLPGEVPARAAGLAEGVLRIMGLSKLKAAAVLVAFHLVAAAWALAQQHGTPSNVPPGIVAASRVERPEPILALDAPAIADEGPTHLAMTLDEAITRMLRDDVELRSRFFQIPQAKADLLAEGLRPIRPNGSIVRTGRHINTRVYADRELVPYGTYQTARLLELPRFVVGQPAPLDLTYQRSVRAASVRRASTIAEAQYLDAARRRVEVVSLAFGEALKARDLAELGRDSVGRLGRLEEVAHAKGEDEVGLRRIEIQRKAAEIDFGKANESLDRAIKALALLLTIPEGQSKGLEVVGKLGHDSHGPELSSLVSEALANRPDLAALGLETLQSNNDPENTRVASSFYPPHLLAGEPLVPLRSDSWPWGVSAPLMLIRPDEVGVERARLKRELFRELATSLGRRITRDVTQARRELEGSLVKAQEAREKETLARYALDTATSRHARGELDLLIVLGAAKDAEDAARALVEAQARNDRSRVALNTVVGRWVVQP